MRTKEFKNQSQKVKTTIQNEKIEIASSVLSFTFGL